LVSSIEPWDEEGQAVGCRPLFDALEGRPTSLYDVDAEWKPPHMGWPRASAPAFDEGAVRIGVERQMPDVGCITAWVHADCRGECPELKELGEAELERRLTANSAGVWPPGQ
jgi:hypothetical protein